MTTKPAGELSEFCDYESLYMMLPLGVHVYHLEDLNDDTSLRLISANKTAEDITGVPAEEIVGRTLDENFPGLRGLDVPQKYAEAIRTGESSSLSTVYYGDERVRQGAYAVHIVPLPGDCVAVCFENISLQLEAEAALKRSEKDLKSLFDNMTSGFAYHKIVADRHGEPSDYIFLEVNSAFETFTGLKREDIVGKLVTEVYPGIQDLEFDWIGIYGKVALTGESIQFEQFFQLQQRWYQINAYCPCRGYFAVTFEDITHRKGIEEELKRSKEQLHELFQRMPSGAVIYEAVDEGADFLIRAFNCAAEQLDDIKKENVLGVRLTKAYPGVAEFGLLEVLQRVYHTGVAEYFPAGLYRDKRIGECWRENWVYKLTTGEVVAIYNDITDRITAGNNLHETMSRLKETAKAGKVGLWDWDMVTNEVTYSDEWKKMIGHERDEIGTSFLEWQSRVHPDDLEATQQRIQQSIDELRQYHAVEFRFRHKDGSYRWIYAQASVFTDESGKPVRMLGSHVDITERKRAEMKLRQSQDRLSSLLESLIDAVLVVDEEGGVKYVNGSACTFFGKTKDELLSSGFGYPVALEELFHITTLGHDGKPRYGEAKASHGEWGDNKVYFISIRDITERNKVLLEHEKLQQQLLQIDKIESIGNLAGGIAHDFNNMLSVILGFGNIVYKQLHENDPLREDVKEIIEAGRRSSSLTRQLLAFSRRQALEPVVVDLNTIIMDMEKMLRRLIGEDIELTTRLAGDLAAVLVDPGQIEQVIVNLVVNGRDAMPLGGRLAIETMNFTVDQQYADGHVDITVGEYVMLSISDTGCGMDEATRAKIYEPFFSTKEEGKGTGLGLSTVYGIVKQSAGHIWVYSEPEQGTTFKLYFPIVTESPTLDKVNKIVQSTAAKGESILVVEDEQSMRKLCQKILTRLGYQVRTAANGGEALLYVEEEGYIPDLVLTDVVMPKMNGKILAERLQKKIPGLKVVFMSGYTDTAMGHHGVLDSGIPFIQKPFSRETIGEKLRQILEQE